MLYAYTTNTTQIWYKWNTTTIQIQNKYKRAITGGTALSFPHLNCTFLLSPCGPTSPPLIVTKELWRLWRIIWNLLLEILLLVLPPHHWLSQYDDCEGSHILSQLTIIWCNVCWNFFVVLPSLFKCYILSLSLSLITLRQLEAISNDRWKDLEILMNY